MPINKPNNYRPDIDGLRAIAVVLVILFHAQFGSVSGGFIGVDVFFVISGFLVTYTIYNELLNKTFTFEKFYLRRIRRILPVLFFLLTLVLVASGFILFADHFEVAARSALHSFISTNNFYLFLNNTNYFADNAHFNPFMHTWSLSIEEQFYFIWPIILLFLVKYLSIKYFKPIVSLLFFLFFILSEYFAYTDKNFSYFMLPARFFELGIGAILAIYWDNLRKIPQIANHFLSIIGIMLILIPAFVLNENSIFPAHNALIPCLGTAFLIISGKQKAIVNQLLSTKIFVKTGLISYSLYLWHWPIIVFYTYFMIPFTGFNRIFGLVIIAIISYLSWKHIELPFRFRFKFDFKNTLLKLVFPALLIIFGLYAIIDKMDGFPERFPTLAEFIPKKNYPNKVRKNCFDTFQIGNCESCYLGIKKQKLDGVLIGDSFGNHSAAFIAVLAKNAGLYLHDTNAGGYPLLTIHDQKGNSLCDTQYAIDRFKFAKKHKIIVVAANWDSDWSKPPNKTYYETIEKIGELIALKKEVYIVDCLRFTSEKNLHKAKLYKSNQNYFFDSKDFSVQKYQRPKSYIVYELKRRYPTLHIIDLNAIMCQEKTCSLSIENEIVYRNFNHQTTSGMETIAKHYLAKFGNPFK
jgi:peptidoglycan/LPS O-acetylase OafA/YrhL